MPTLVLHAEDDAICPVELARLFANRMTTADRPCRIIMYPTRGHGFHRQRNGQDAYHKSFAQATTFLASQGLLPH